MTMPTPSNDEVRQEVRQWLADHWDPAIPARQWGAMVVDSGWACPTWSPSWFGKGLPATSPEALCVR